MTHQIETVTVQGSPMEVFLFTPPTAKGKGPHPALVLCPHIPVAHAGLETDPVTLHKGERYAEAGYVVAAPFYFHWWPKSVDIDTKREQTRDDQTQADLDAAFELLAKRPDVDPNRIGIVGHCWGGRMAWLGLVTNPRYKAGAVFYGGRVKVAMGPNTPPPIELTSNIKCPVIGFFGNEDTNPTPADVNDYEAALKKAGVPCEFHRYDGAGHAFQTYTNPERYREGPSEDAWAKAIKFFDAKL